MHDAVWNNCYILSNHDISRHGMEVAWEKSGGPITACRRCAQCPGSERPFVLGPRQSIFWRPRCSTTCQSCCDCGDVVDVALIPIHVSAHDDGQYADSPLKTWFDKLASGKGLCCSFADGVCVEDVDWDTQVTAIVCALGAMVLVPDTAVVTEPNKFGPAVVWPYQDADAYPNPLFPSGRGSIS